MGELVRTGSHVEKEKDAESNFRNGKEGTFHVWFLH
jgi:hypothetical protein